MPSISTITDWCHTDAKLFEDMVGMPVPFEFEIASESKLEAALIRMENAVDTKHKGRMTTNGMAITLPGRNGIGVVFRQKFITSRSRFRYILWHEMGHVFSFLYEWDGPSPDNGEIDSWPLEIKIAYKFWAECIAESLAHRAMRAYGCNLSVGLNENILSALKLMKKKDIFGSVVQLGMHFALETTYHCINIRYTTNQIPDAIRSLLDSLAALIFQKFSTDQYWKIDYAWLQSISVPLWMIYFNPDIANQPKGNL